MIFIVLQSRNSIKRPLFLFFFPQLPRLRRLLTRRELWKLNPDLGQSRSRGTRPDMASNMFFIRKVRRRASNNPKKGWSWLINKSDKKTDCERLSWFANNRDRKCNMLYSRRMPEVPLRSSWTLEGNSKPMQIIIVDQTISNSQICPKSNLYDYDELHTINKLIWRHRGIGCIVPGILRILSLWSRRAARI